MAQDGSPLMVKQGVFVRLDRSLFAALDVAAADADLSRAGWTRREIARALPNRSDISSLLPSSPPRRQMVIPGEDLAAVSRLSAALSHTGGAVVQLCRALRETGHANHAHAEAVLAELRLVQADVARLVGHLRA